LKIWGAVLNKILKNGDRTCQSHFCRESVKKEDITGIKSNRIAKVVPKNVHISIIIVYD